MPVQVQEVTAKVDEYARGMISGSGSTLFEELGWGACDCTATFIVTFYIFSFFSFFPLCKFPLPLHGTSLPARCLHASTAARLFPFRPRVYILAMHVQHTLFYLHTVGNSRPEP